MSFLFGVLAGVGICLVVFLVFFIWIGFLIDRAEWKQDEVETTRKRLEEMFKK